ncbi:MULTISPECIES: site-specific integrase [Chitinilyticum]|uniref:Site-specific integrase n=1 Tax=Chitinilyticum piscinae TaxID=2866724 RepID=A0A8J7KC84_9NEIS|nr:MULTISPECIES: site-specific integrase [Chitinilyticum]MBE9607734.1 site-specific integrase [Chitinilyticum piscinae]
MAHLSKRNGIYYFRCRIPSTLISHFKKTEIWKSLRTSDRKTAILRCAKIQISFQLQMLKMVKPIPTVEEMLEQELRDASIAAIENGTYWDSWTAPDPQPELELSKDQIEAIETEGAAFTRHYEWLGARREGMAMMAATHEEEQRRVAAQPTSNQLVSDLIKTLKSAEMNIKQDGKLSKIYEMYIEEKTLSGVGVAQITSLKEVIYGILTGFFGAEAVCSDVTDERVHELFTLIQQLPQKFTLTPDWKTKIDRARELEGTLSFTTVKRKWLTVLEIFSSNSALTFFKRSPFEGVRFKKNDKRNKQKKTYKLFNDTELVALFAQSHLKFNAKRPAQYWVPLIGLYAGLRLNEACQLLVADIKQHDGIWCFRVQESADDNDQSIKTEYSERNTPIHSKLIQLGLLEYANSQAKTGRLFPELTWTAKNKWGGSTSTWFGRYKTGHGINDPEKVFHSLRKHFNQSMKDNGVTEEIREAASGHAPTGINSEIYANKTLTSMLKDAVEAVRFPCLDGVI